MPHDQKMSDLAARIFSLHERRDQLDEEEQRLHAELMELFERVKKLGGQSLEVADVPPDSP
jgi:chromosome segregation ATPase